MSSSASTACFRRRRGVSILEVSAAAAMLAVLLTLLAQLFLHVRQHTQRSEQRSTMIRVVENLLEEFTAAPWDDINADAIGSLQLPAELRTRWPQATVAGQVDESSERLAAKRIALTLSLGASSRQRPVTLTTWVYRRGED